MMLPCCDFMMARQKALPARVSIATVKMFPEARCMRLPLRTAIANVPDSKPTVPARIWRTKSESRMLLHPFSIGHFNKDRSPQRRCANTRYICVQRKLSPLITSAIMSDFVRGIRALFPVDSKERYQFDTAANMSRIAGNQ